MNEFRKKHPNSKIRLHAKYRKELPCGCKKPKPTAIY